MYVTKGSHKNFIGNLGVESCDMNTLIVHTILALSIRGSIDLRINILWQHNSW